MRGSLDRLSSPQKFEDRLKETVQTNRATLDGADCSAVPNNGTSDGKGVVSRVMIARMKRVPVTSYEEGDEYNDKSSTPPDRPAKSMCR